MSRLTTLGDDGFGGFAKAALAAAVAEVVAPVAAQETTAVNFTRLMDEAPTRRNGALALSALPGIGLD